MAMTMTPTWRAAWKARREVTFIGTVTHQDGDMQMIPVFVSSPLPPIQFMSVMFRRRHVFNADLMDILRPLPFRRTPGRADDSVYGVGGSLRWSGSSDRIEENGALWKRRM